MEIVRTIVTPVRIAIIIAGKEGNNHAADRIADPFYDFEGRKSRHALRISRRMRHGFYDELSRQDIRHILLRHEQGAIHAADGDLVLFADGEEIAVSTENEPVRFLLITGKPIGEPVAWYGPIVMNTREELRIAFEEYEKGAFIKHKKA